MAAFMQNCSSLLGKYNYNDTNWVEINVSSEGILTWSQYFTGRGVPDVVHDLIPHESGSSSGMFLTPAAQGGLVVQFNQSRNVLYPELRQHRHPNVTTAAGMGLSARGG